MEPDKAVELIGDFASVQVQLCKESNTNRGCTKRSLKQESVLATKLFEALTGQKPTVEQLSQMEVK